MSCVQFGIGLLSSQLRIYSSDCVMQTSVYAMAVMSVRPSVRPSITLVYCIKKAKDRHDSPSF